MELDIGLRIAPYLGAAAAAALLTILLTPWVGRIAGRLGAMDEPDHRKVHCDPIPRLGGLAIFAGFLGGLAVYLGTSPSEANQQLLGLLIGCVIIVVVGVLDDVKSMAPKYKFLGQAIAVTVFLLLGPRIEFIGTPWGSVFYFDPVLSYVVTFVWIVALVNIINFIDGLDGLAAGVSAIAAGSLFVYALLSGHGAGAFLPLILAAAALGFLWHNFNPASIFMGDSGSMLLGFVLGVVTISGVTKGIGIVSLLVPLVVVAIPIFDTLFAIIRRLVDRKPVTAPDKGHIHHRLLDKGHSQKQTVLRIYAWSVVLSLAALGLEFAPPTLRVVVVAALVAFSFWFVHSLGLFEALWDTMADRTTPPRARKDYGSAGRAAGAAAGTAEGTAAGTAAGIAEDPAIAAASETAGEPSAASAPGETGAAESPAVLLEMLGGIEAVTPPQSTQPISQQPTPQPPPQQHPTPQPLASNKAASYFSEN